MKKVLKTAKVKKAKVETAKLVDQHVGKRLREFRTRLGLTQEQIAISLGLSYQQVQKYETGATRVSAGRLYELAEILEVEIPDFFDGVNLDASVVPMPHGGRNRVSIGLVRDFGEITNPDVRAAVSGLVRAVAHQSGGTSKSRANGSDSI